MKLVNPLSWNATWTINYSINVKIDQSNKTWMPWNGSNLSNILLIDCWDQLTNILFYVGVLGSRGSFKGVLQWPVMAHRMKTKLLNVVSRTCRSGLCLLPKLISHHAFNDSHCDQPHLTSFKLSKPTQPLLGSMHLTGPLHVLFLMFKTLFPLLSIINFYSSFRS